MSAVTNAESALALIHAVPQNLVARAQLALCDALGHNVKIAWMPLPSHSLRMVAPNQLEQRLFSAQVTFAPNFDSVSMIASELASLRTVWFEVSSLPFDGELGQRYCYTPVLGLFHSQIDTAGNQVFGENQLLAILESHTHRNKLKTAQNSGNLPHQLKELLGIEWDAQLEPLRAAKLNLNCQTELAS